MGWIVLGGGWAIWYSIGKRIKPKGQAPKKGVNISVLLAAFVAGCGLALTWLGARIAWLVALIPDRDVEIAVCAVLAIVTLIAFVGDMAFDKKADKPAQYSAFLAPTILLLIAGSFMGVSGADIVNGVIDLVGPSLKELGGGH